MGASLPARERIPPATVHDPTPAHSQDARGDHGIGLHSGTETRVRVAPAPPHSGIEFVRIDLEDAPSVPAFIDHQSPKDRRTRLVRDRVEVETVEHFLAAAKALGVDNLRVEMSGPEFPGLDGSSMPFVELLESGGIVEQKAEAKVFRLEEPVFVRDGNATLVALPTDGDGLTLQYVASFDEPGVESGSYQFELSRGLPPGDRVGAHLLPRERGGGPAGRRPRQGPRARTPSSSATRTRSCGWRASRSVTRCST